MPIKKTASFRILENDERKKLQPGEQIFALWPFYDGAHWCRRLHVYDCLYVYSFVGYAHEGHDTSPMAGTFKNSVTYLARKVY